ncbi:MAG: dTMP kinase [Acidimicrobiia bacterium]
MLLIAIEGIDRAGKTTQTELLASWLRERGRQVATLSFPRYDSFFGRKIRALLDGHGAVSAATLDPESMSLWYALDRWDAFAHLDAGADVVLLNRYTLSNAVYQSSRTTAEDADRLFAWIIELEHGRLALPVPALTVVLDVAPALSQARARAGDRAEQPDVYERSAALLDAARQRYLTAAEQVDGVVIVGAGGHDGSGDVTAVQAAVRAVVSPLLDR